MLKTRAVGAEARQTWPTSAIAPNSLWRWLLGGKGHGPACTDRAGVGSSDETSKQCAGHGKVGPVSDTLPGRTRLSVVGRPTSAVAIDQDVHPAKPVGTDHPAPGSGDTNATWTTQTSGGIDPGQVTCAATTLLTALRIDDLT